jgi:hypothetical protein
MTKFSDHPSLDPTPRRAVVRVRQKIHAASTLSYAAKAIRLPISGDFDLDQGMD